MPSIEKPQPVVEHNPAGDAPNLTRHELAQRKSERGRMLDGNYHPFVRAENISTFAGWHYGQFEAKCWTKNCRSR